MTHSLLEAKNITCYRGDRLLLHNFNLHLDSGQLLQVVGPNGVGKTTLLRILTGVLQSYQGDVLWQGMSIQKRLNEYYKDIFYIGHDLGIKAELTVFENLRFDLRYKNCRRSQIMDAIEALNLDHFHSSLCRNLSQGQRQRVALAKLALSNVRLWILDEPFASLDDLGMQKMQLLFKQKVQEGGSILLATHRLLTLKSLPVCSLQLVENR